MAVETLFDDATHPTSAFDEGTGMTLAMTVYFDQDGACPQAAFWGPSNLSGSYTMAMWEATSDDDPPNSGTGVLLDTTTDFDVTPAVDIWNWATFDPPVPVVAGVAYRIGFISTAGRYTSQGAFFASGESTSGDIHAPQDTSNPIGLGPLSNGVYYVGTDGTYPRNTFNSAWYGVNIRFEATVVPVEGDATFTGTAGMSAAATVDHGGVAQFGGVGALSAAASVVRAGIATTAGVGGLTATASVVREAVARFTGTGGLTATGTVTRATTAVFGGTSGMTATATVDRAGSATFGGVGDLTADAASAGDETATFGGTGGLDGSAAVGRAGAATAAGVGGLAASAAVTRAGSATFGGAGGLAASATVDHGTTAVFGGVGGLTATATVTRNGSATFTGIGGLAESSEPAPQPVPVVGTATVREYTTGTTAVREWAVGTATVR